MTKMLQKLIFQKNFYQCLLKIRISGDTVKVSIQTKSLQRVRFIVSTIGSSSWARTSDKWINSPLLYQLSYRGMRMKL